MMLDFRKLSPLPFALGGMSLVMLCGALAVFGEFKSKQIFGIALSLAIFCAAAPLLLAVYRDLRKD